MDHVDVKYVLLLSSRLDRFKESGNNVYNFRCPFCGDSKTNKVKARGYIYPNNGNLSYRCHNCGYSIKLQTFIKELDIGLYTEYKLEKFGNFKRIITKPEPTRIEFKRSDNQLRLERNMILTDCVAISNIGDTHPLKPIKDYVINRKIPEKYYSQIFATSSISNISKKIEKYQNIMFPEFPSLVIPFYSETGMIDYIQCRRLDVVDDGLRYTTFELDSIAMKIWGLNSVNWNNRIYLFEGPIDAMCVDNALAMAGVSQSIVLSYLLSKQPNKHNICICYDSDYKTNSDILRELHRRIDSGYSVIIYDKQFIWKDINAAIEKGNWTHNEIKEYLENRTFKGMKAKLELSKQLNRK